MFLWPAYFVAGAGWFVLGRNNAGWLVLAVHSVAAVMTVGYGLLLVFGTGDFAGPGRNPPWTEFFAWLTASLAITVVSVAFVVAQHGRQGR